MQDRIRQLCKQISQTLEKAGIEHTINQIGSMFTLFFTDEPVTSHNSAIKSDTKRYAKYFTQMLKAGIYLPPSQFEANFLSTQHTQRHIDQTVSAIKKVKF